MLTIIFGAGASYDSDPDHPSVSTLLEYRDDNRWPRPPLAKDIFSARYGKQAETNIAAQSLFPQLRRATPNIEHELGKILDSASSYPPVHRQLLSMRYYIRDVIVRAQTEWVNECIHSVSTYHEFLNAIDRWKFARQKNQEKTALITFNYDTLLDRACSAVLRFPIKTSSSYVTSELPYQLFKVHGSIDWIREVSGVTDNNVIDSAEQLHWTNNIAKGHIATKEYVDLDGNLETIESGHDFVPAIAIPTETKKNFEMPTGHLEKMVDSIKTTSSLLIIGWRGAEQHFLNLWKAHADPTKLKLLGIVSTDPKRAMEISGRLAEGGITSNHPRFFYNGFSGFVAKDLDHFLLETHNSDFT